MTGVWASRAKGAILAVHNALPADAPLDERVKAIDAAYPFGLREHFPYKAWLAERRRYLAKYGYRPRSARPADEPLFDRAALQEQPK